MNTTVETNSFDDKQVIIRLALSRNGKGTRISTGVMQSAVMLALRDLFKRALPGVHAPQYSGRSSEDFALQVSAVYSTNPITKAGGIFIGHATPDPSLSWLAVHTRIDLSYRGGFAYQTPPSLKLRGKFTGTAVDMFSPLPSGSVVVLNAGCDEFQWAAVVQIDQPYPSENTKCVLRAVALYEPGTGAQAFWCENERWQTALATDSFSSLCEGQRHASRTLPLHAMALWCRIAAVGQETFQLQPELQKTPGIPGRAGNQGGSRWGGKSKSRSEEKSANHSRKYGANMGERDLINLVFEKGERLANGEVYVLMVETAGSDDYHYLVVLNSFSGGGVMLAKMTPAAVAGLAEWAGRQ